MKKTISFILLILISITGLNVKGNTEIFKKDPYHLVLEGEFLKEKNVNYTVFKMDKNGVFTMDYQVKAKKYYTIVCNTGDKYLIRFENKDKKVKTLMVDVTISGTFTIDVDFSKEKDAVLSFTKKGYNIDKLPDNLLVIK